MNKKFFYYFNIALAAIASAATLFCAVAPEDWLGTRTWCLTIAILAVILFICAYFAWGQTKLKNRISIKISPNLRVNVFKGDLFQQNNIVVIPVNEFFDTHVDDVIIAHRTIHGKFIDDFFRNNEDELYRLIDAQINNIEGRVVVNNRRHAGARNYKYPIGTCADVVVGDTIYVLFALTHFDEEDKAYLPKEEFGNAIINLTNHLAAISNNRPVYIPLFGTGLSRLNETHQRVLLYIIDTISFSCPVSINAGMNVVIYPEDMVKVNLNKVEDFFSETLSDVD
jgi:hypothetical protein